jgi:CRP-like cAMP-binding protein
MKHDPKVDVLAQVPMFRSFSRRELAHVARIADEVEMHDGDVLCREGDRGEWCFVLVDAEARVVVEGVEVAHLGPGEICGELSLLDGGSRAATVTLTRGGEVLLLPRGAFLGLLEENPKLVGAILASLGERLRAANAIGAHSVVAGG